MRRTMTVQKQSGKVKLAGPVGAGVPKMALKQKDTEFYQVGPHGDYVQETN